jgi:predicted PurR-regulated permease PerM
MANRTEDGRGQPARRSDAVDTRRSDAVDMEAADAEAAPPGEPVAEAERIAERISTDEEPLGPPGQPLNHRSPFFLGLAGAAGIAVTYVLFQLLAQARSVLVLIGLAWFLAIGLDPAVRWLGRRGLPRWGGVLAVSLAVLGLVGGFFAAAVPTLVQQGTQFAGLLPRYLHQLQDHSSLLGRLNDEFHIQQQVQSTLEGQTSDLVGGLLGAGRVVFGAAASTFTVAVLTLYFLADHPRIRRLLYRLVPHSRRPRAILIGDEVFARVGGFVLGNLITSLVAGVATFVWLEIFQVPYAVLLSMFVALMDLIPVVGSTLGGVVVCLVALTVSMPIALSTAGYIVAYRLAEDYLLVPKIIGKTVRVPSLVTVVAVLLGGALLGIVGALVAIPVAAAIGLLLEAVVFPRLDRS